MDSRVVVSVSMSSISTKLSSSNYVNPLFFLANFSASALALASPSSEDEINELELILCRDASGLTPSVGFDFSSLGSTVFND
jgi:hypothetical protein